MIRPSPLSLKRYFVEEIYVAVRPPATPTVEYPSELNVDELDVAVEHFQKEDLKIEFLCRLIVKSRESVRWSPYNFSIKLAGVFHLPDVPNSPNRDQHIRFSMPSILWASAREVLQSQMEKGPFPAPHLPVVTFLPDIEPQDPLKGAGTALGGHQVP
jgi:preprotein translocase subunit SecB